MKKDHYKKFTVEDWIQDPSFRNYILHNDSSHENYWTELSSENEEVRHRMKEASDILLAMNQLHRNHQEEGLNRANRSLLELENRIRIRKKESYRKILTVGSVAASIALIGLLIWLMWPSPQPVLYQTAMDETEEVTLPDGSIVYLNENSTLTTDGEWIKGNREVTLSGEAYFMVRPQMNARGNKVKFTVNTGGLEIEVLGTQFNVNMRDTVTSIALDEGSIKLVEENGLTQEQESVMVPGQVAFYNTQSRKIRVREQSSVDEQSSWKPQVIEFNEITLKDALAKMETVFDVHFTARKGNIKDLKIKKLSVPSDKPEVFIKTVNILFADKITIRSAPDTNTYQIEPLTPSINQ